MNSMIARAHEVLLSSSMQQQWGKCPHDAQVTAEQAESALGRTMTTELDLQQIPSSRRSLDAISSNSNLRQRTEYDLSKNENIFKVNLQHPVIIITGHVVIAYVQDIYHVTVHEFRLHRSPHE